MTENIISPVGRFVSGSITEVQTTDYQGKPLDEDKQRYSFGVAFRKDDPKINEIFAYLHTAAMANPQHAAMPAVQQFDLNGYSWKVKDGDLANSKGVTNDNSKGCWVMYFSSSFPIKTCDASNAQIDASTVKRGYYVDMVFNARANDRVGGNAGIYLNPEWVRLIAFGAEITGGVDAKTAFANAPAPAQLPPGASATPLPGSAPSQAMTSGAPAASPAPATVPPSSPAPTPAHDFVQNALPGGALPGGAPGPR